MRPAIARMPCRIVCFSPEGQLKRSAVASVPIAKRCAMGDRIQLADRVARVPSFFKVVLASIVCPHCGYSGVTADSSQGATHLACFRAQELLNVYHDVVGAAEHRSGGLCLLIDRFTFDIDTMEEARETNLVCGRCSGTFPAPHPLRFI